MNPQTPPQRNPGPPNMPVSSITDFSKPARRFNDHKARDVEHAARNIAQSEGPTSEAWLTLTRIDKYRRDGRVIEVTMLYKVHGETGHRVKWVERESEFAKIHGYIDPTMNPQQPTFSKGATFMLTVVGTMVGIYLGVAYALYMR